jgi:REP element-mobilizing transposase RayT
MWNLTPPPGFQGLRDDLPLTMYFRHLPHWRQPGATYFVTFRLEDSLPQSKLRELAAWREEWKRQNPSPLSHSAWENLARGVMQRVETWLDQGMGSCILRDSANATIVTDSMHYFDGQRYELASYVVMPNHAHLLIRPFDADENSLEAILQSWKQFTATRLNKRLGRRGTLWQQESFDRIVRDEEHLYRCIQYIGSNVARSQLTTDDCPRWIRPEWESFGWKFACDT